MKKLMKLSYRLASACLLSAALTACVNELRVPTSPEEVAADINRRFDFDNWTPATLKVDMGEPTYVVVYDSDPAVDPAAREVRAFPTDRNGCFECRLELGASMIGKDFYAVGENGATAKATYNGRDLDFKAPARSRDGESYTYGPNADVKEVCRRLREFYHDIFPEYGNQYRRLWNHLGFWYDYGMVGINYHSERDNYIHTTGDTEVWINMVDFGEAWRSAQDGAFDGNGQYKAQLYYYYFKDGAAMGLHSRFLQPQYFAHTIISDKFRLIPDPADYPDGSRDVFSSDADNTEENLGKMVRLKFYGDISEDCAQGTPFDKAGGVSAGYDRMGYDFTNEDSPSYTFPAGYNIGFVLVMGDNTLELRSDGKQYIYADKNVMILSSPTDGYRGTDWPHWYEIFYGNDKPFGCVSFSGDDVDTGLWPDDVSPYAANNTRRLFYTYEDNPDDQYYRDWWEDDEDLWDYNDFMFMVTVKEDDEDTTPRESRASRFGTYMFEDLYPDAGDYDMNDVMVEYYYTVSFDEATGDIKSFYYNIRPMHNGADYVNDFYLAHTRPGAAAAVQCVYRNNITVTKGSNFFGRAWIDGDGVHSLNQDGDADAFAESFIGATYTDTGFWRQEAEVGGVTAYFGIDPFIYVDNSVGNQVHLTKFRWQDIGKGASESANPYLKFYLVDTRPEEFAGLPYPFAIDLAQCYDVPVPRESIPLWDQYPQFNLWCGNDGTTNKDWYNHPK